MDWQPILVGELADRARARLVEIATDVARGDGPPADGALFWSHAAPLELLPETDRHAAEAYERFAKWLEAVFTRGPDSLSFTRGLAFAAWVAGQVADDVDEVLTATDDAVLAVLAGPPDDAVPYDFHAGLVGFGGYLLARGDTAAVAPGLSRIVDHLKARARLTERGATWHTSPALLPAPVAAEWPQGMYNCGVAHGVPAVIALLTRISARPDVPDGAVPLRDAATRWLLSWRNSDGSFPLWVDATRRHGVREAWCYGRPGIAAALTAALPPDQIAEINDSWMALGTDEAGVEDAGMCHGAAGLGHLSNRVYQRDGLEQQAVCARRWLERALDSRLDSADPLDFWDGAVGVGLALIAGLEPVEPRWNELLLPGGL